MVTSDNTISRPVHRLEMVTGAGMRLGLGLRSRRAPNFIDHLMYRVRYLRAVLRPHPTGVWHDLNRMHV